MPPDGACSRKYLPVHCSPIRAEPEMKRGRRAAPPGSAGGYSGRACSWMAALSSGLIGTPIISPEGSFSRNHLL